MPRGEIGACLIGTPLHPALPCYSRKPAEEFGKPRSQMAFAFIVHHALGYRVPFGTKRGETGQSSKQIKRRAPATVSVNL